MNFYGMTRGELEAYFASLKANKSKTKFLMRAVYGKGLDSAEGISPPLMSRIKEDISFEALSVVKKQEDETACKYLLKLADGNLVEAVKMKEPYGDTVCISTQVGCNMGCAFCESGNLKKVRNLAAWEMTAQVMAVKDSEKPLYGVSVMGIGEPFDNYRETLKFISIITDQFGLSIPPRHITVSTAGLVPQIKAFSESDCGANLAVSLHAPSDALRSSLMPINRKYNLTELVTALEEFSQKRNRRVTVEYIMLENVNDSTEHAAELSSLLKNLKCYVNIIPYNPTRNLPFTPSDRQRIMAFYDILKKNKIRVTMRRKMGDSLSAACGQLRSNCEKH